MDKSAAASGSRRALALLLLFSLVACGKRSSASPDSGAFTLHYHRALSDYAGWQAQVSAGSVLATASSTSTDGFGALYQLSPPAGATSFTVALSKGGES
jgi:hypothetical protein